MQIFQLYIYFRQTGTLASTENAVKNLTLVLLIRLQKMRSFQSQIYSVCPS